MKLVAVVVVRILVFSTKQGFFTRSFMQSLYLKKEGRKEGNGWYIPD